MDKTRFFREITREKSRVSVQGVESLWGDCRFMPADWGSIPLICLNFSLFSCNFTKKIQFDHSKSPKLNSKTVRSISLFQAFYVCIYHI